MKTNSILLAVALALCACDRETPRLAAENADLRQTVARLKAERSQQREALGIQISSYQKNAEADPLVTDPPASKEGLARENDALKFQVSGLQAQISKERNALGRKLAQTLLDQHLSKPRISKIDFSDSGFQKAKDDKLIVLGAVDYVVTDKGVAVFGRLSNTTYIDGLSNNHTLGLRSTLPEKVTSIDGIADAGNGKKLVEFTTDYIFPKETPAEITRYLYSGRKAKAIFVLYDDGWRVADEN